MDLSLDQYEELAKRFNSKPFSEKIKLLIKHPDLIILGSDNGWFVVKAVAPDIQEKLYESGEGFDIQNEWGYKEAEELLYALGLKVTDA